MTKLHLNVGDRVRNIFNSGEHFRWIGVVTNVKLAGGRGLGGFEYHVKWGSGASGDYPQKDAHKYLEKVVDSSNGNNPTMTWADLKDMPPSQREPVYSEWYHADLSHLNEALVADKILQAWRSANPGLIMPADDTTPPRKVLKRVRRNVLTGWTQDELVSQYGHAKGVANFNTRALGKTTGQVLACIADAINNPGKPVAINGVDHARARPGNSTSWTTLNKHFLATIQSTIDKLGLKGFTVEPKKGIMTFNPIVVEETYVEVHNAR